MSKGSERLRGAFSDGRVALMPYLTAGYPTLDGAREVGEAYVSAGADIVEIGVPFSDPLADGPTIQDTTTRALENGADLNYCLDLASGISDRVPVVFLVYYNVIFARGTERFLELAADAGVSGLVIPDLPVDELGEFGKLAESKKRRVVPARRPDLDGRSDSRDRESGVGIRILCLGRGCYRCPRDVAAGCGGVAAAGAFEGRGAGGAGVWNFHAGRRRLEAAGEADGVIIGSKLMQLVAEGGPEKAGEWLGEVREAILDGSRAEVGERH